jgi:protein-S-isoprenylcysteine O-methyltransferase Ste14
MSYPVSVDQSTLQQWVAAKIDPSAVEEKLKIMGLDTESIATQLKAYKRLCNAKKQFMGFVFMAVGAFLGFVSCVLSLVNPIPELYNVILFGLTSVAIIVIFIGMYCVFE